MEQPRTPIDNLLNVLSGFSVGHEKALKQGIYNAIALFLLSLVCIASYGLYLILHPFVKPLIWALLCGSVLFPFKFYIANTVECWFIDNEHSHKPLMINLAMVPVKIMDKLSDSIGVFLYGHIKYVQIILASCFASLLIYWYTPNIFICIIWRLIQIGVTLISFIVTSCNIYMISTTVVGYFIALCLYWKPDNAVTFNYLAVPVWLMFSLYVSNIFGAYEVALFCALQILCIVGFTYEVIVIMEQKEVQGKPLTFAEAVQQAFVGDNTVDNPVQCKSEDLDEDEEEKKNIFIEHTSTPISPDDLKEPSPLSAKNPSLKYLKRSMSLNTGIGQRLNETKKSNRSSSLSNQRNLRDRYFLGKIRSEFRMSLDYSDNQVDTNKYMYGAVYACAGMIMWKHKWILMLLTIPIAWYSIKLMGRYFGLWDTIKKRINLMNDTFQLWYMERHQAIVPAHARGLFQIYILVDKKLQEILRSSIDAVATIVVILALLIFTFCASIFIVIQIYGEGIHLIQVTGEILNSTLVNNPDIDWVPQQWESSVNSVLDNAYTYGRTAISNGVKNLVKDLEPTKAEILERKVIELWDRLYQAWMQSDEPEDMIGPTVDAAAAMSVWESLKESFGKMPTQTFNMASIQNFAKENVGTLMSVLDSVWGIVKGNMSIVFSILTELLWIVLMSGSVVLNFTLSTVVFFTTLFYLLNSSKKTYKPIQLIAMFSPMSLYRFAIALQEAVIGVFAATFKLASFFGMWTWFIHNLFQVKIVYLPSAFATLLAAVPFLDAYFACIPATIELWFTRDSMTAILFFIFHFLPCNIVITDFYKEIKGGGHPYLTGLSIAGGVFCLGIQGAIFGPLLLCCIMVAINLSRKYIQSLSDEPLDYKLEAEHHATP